MYFPRMHVVPVGAKPAKMPGLSTTSVCAEVAVGDVQSALTDRQERMYVRVHAAVTGVGGLRGMRSTRAHIDLCRE